MGIVDDLSQKYQQLTAGGEPFGFTIELDEDELEILPFEEVDPDNMYKPRRAFDKKSFGQSKVSFTVKIASPKPEFRCSATLVVRAHARKHDSVPFRTLFHGQVLDDVGTGTYTVTWDGFGNNGPHDGILRTEDFLTRDLEVALEVFETDGERKERRLKLEAGNIAGELVGGGRIDFLEMEIDRNAKTAEVTVALNLRKGETVDPSTGKDWFDDLVSLVKAGIQRYWSRDIDLNGETYKVTVRCDTWSKSSQAFDLNLWLKVNDESYHESIPKSVKDAMPDRLVEFIEDADASRLGSSRRFPYMDGQLFLWIKRYSDPYLSDNFKRIVAHEFGHTVLYYSEGLKVSVSHKDTSTLLQKRVTHSPYYPATGEIDIMLYPNADKANTEPSDLLQRVRAVEDDVKRLFTMMVLGLKER